MGVYLSKKPDDTLSHLDFGELDTQLTFNKTIYWVNVVTSSDWFLKLSSAFIGEERINLGASSAIIDTGSSYLAIPLSKVRAKY